MSLPRLNQLAIYFPVTRASGRGQLAKGSQISNIPCRFSIKTGTFRDNRGQDITYNATIHLGTEYCTIKKGDGFTLDNKDYIITDVITTPNLKGKYFFQFAYLQESYFV